MKTTQALQRHHVRRNQFGSEEEASKDVSQDEISKLSRIQSNAVPKFDWNRENQKLKLQSEELEILEVDAKAARRCNVIRGMIDEMTSMPYMTPDLEEPISISEVNMSILKKVMMWCNYHRDDRTAESQSLDHDDQSTAKMLKLTNDTTAWDVEFFKVDQATLLEIIAAANFLDIPDLLDKACRVVADMIKGKSPEEIRRTFNIQNDFTQSEENQIRMENSWCDFTNRMDTEKR
ncbi:hypothetical protein ACOME3_005233 [Neoechinorhynchus agilis]